MTDSVDAEFGVSLRHEVTVDEHVIDILVDVFDVSADTITLSVTHCNVKSSRVMNQSTSIKQSNDGGIA